MPRSLRPLIALYHDIEQNLDSEQEASACRDAVRQMLAIEGRLGIRTTYNVVACLLRDQPDLRSWIRDGGHEIGVHSFDHPRDWGPPHFVSQVEKARTEEPDVDGYRSPRSQWDDRTTQRLWELGFRWSAEADSAAVPYFVHRDLVRIPIARDDWPLVAGGWTVDQWVDDCVRLMHERRFVAIGTHDFVVAMDPISRLTGWERVCTAAQELGAHVITFSEATDLFRRAVLGRADGGASPPLSSTWTGQRLVEMRELVEAEIPDTGPLNIALLGSAGALLTSGIRQRAGTIHQVLRPAGRRDHGRKGMKRRVQHVVAEAPATGLPGSSCDAVIVLDVVEYEYWPRRIAWEIARITKPGGICIVGLPAQRPPPTGDDGPCRAHLMRPFTKTQVQSWGRNVGEGRVVPFYDGGFRTSVDERAPTQHGREVGWMWIGTPAGAQSMTSSSVAVSEIDDWDLPDLGDQTSSPIARWMFAARRSMGR